MNKAALKYTLIAIVTVGLLYLAFRGQNIAESFDAMERANIGWLLAGIAMMLISHMLRAFRWQIVLRPLKRKTSFWRAFKATIAGYGMNNLIPRSGEIVRPYIMSRGEGIPLAGAIASVVVERLADVVALAGLVAYSLLVYRDRVTSAFPMLTGNMLVALAVMLLLLISFILLFFSEKRTTQFLSVVTRPLPANLGQKIGSIGRDFSKGLRGLDRSSILPLFLGTIGIWGLYGVSMYLSLKGFNDPAMAQLQLPDAFLLLTLSGIAFTIPIPGGTGSYHLLIKTGLVSIFGVSPVIAAAYAIATHALSYISMIVFGIIILIQEGISIGSTHSLKEERSEPLPPSSFNLHPSPGRADG